MENDLRFEKIAVLIDADNAQLSMLYLIMKELSSYGRVLVKRAYGNWGNQLLKNWERELKKLAIKPEQQFAYTLRKNATDIALVIDAMDLLSANMYDAFAIVCSDADYTPLIIRLRESGAYIFGFGEDKTPPAFRDACDKFILTKHLVKGQHKSGADDCPEDDSNFDIRDIRHIHDLLKLASDNHQDATKWVDTAKAGSYMRSIQPNFDTSRFGYSKLSDLLKAFPEIYEHKYDDNKSFFYRLKEESLAQDAACQAEEIACQADENTPQAEEVACQADEITPQADEASDEITTEISESLETLETVEANETCETERQADEASDDVAPQAEEALPCDEASEETPCETPDEATDEMHSEMPDEATDEAPVDAIGETLDEATAPDDAPRLIPPIEDINESLEELIVKTNEVIEGWERPSEEPTDDVGVEVDGVDETSVVEIEIDGDVDINVDETSVDEISVDETKVDGDVDIKVDEISVNIISVAEIHDIVDATDDITDDIIEEAAAQDEPIEENYET